MRLTRWAASRNVIAALALAGTMIVAMPVAAQDDARLRKIEAEIRAIQRQVFPNGEGRFFTPEVVTPNGQVPVQNVGTPSETAVTDILARLDSLEAQLAMLTARSEENANALAQLEARLALVEPRAEPLPLTPAPAPAQSTTGPALSSPAPARATPTPTPAPAPARATPAPTPTPAAAARPTGPSAERLERVRAILKPDTGDAGDDDYTYGFRLWDAGFFPEAQQALKQFVDKHPSHSRISFGRNLLGRAYFDDGQPRAAAPFFLENYQKDPNGARAPDSLLYLAESMIALKDTARACRALAEFSTKYPAVATGRLQSQYDKDRRAVTC
ncbi:tetratricopeptide repeat protein [Tsuneonella sp. HG222]